MKFLPHDLRQVKYKILRLDFQKNNFLVLGGTVANMAVFISFRARKCVGPLGVNQNGMI